MTFDPRSVPAGAGPHALVLRHAERPPLPDDATGHDVALTPAGRASAEALGRALAPVLASVASSPIRRCLETAEALAGGIVVHEDVRLGGPGPYVADLDRAWSRWRTLGHDGVLAALTSGQDEVPGLHPLRATSRALARSLLASAGRAPGVHVFVTHDVVLAPLVACLLGRPLGRPEWPGFLEPLLLAGGESPTATYRGETRPIAAFLAGA